MSIFPEVHEMILAEHAYRPILGDIVLIGRQKVEFSIKTDKDIFNFEGTSFHALDVSPFEGADIIWDLNVPVPLEMHGIADFMFDGSCLDNIFDAGVAMRNLSKMLRPGGRIVLMEHSTAIQGAITMFSPEWFFNFFALNDYVDCQIKACYFPNGLFERWVIEDCPVFDASEKFLDSTSQALRGHFMTVVLAEKGENSTDDKTPIQAQYRVMHGTDDPKYIEAHRRYMSSRRRV